MTGWNNVNDRMEMQRFFSASVESVTDAGAVTFTGGLTAAGFAAEGENCAISFDSEWLNINRTQNSPDTPVGLSFEAKGVTVFTFGLDYMMNEVALWCPAVGDVWRVDPASGKMVIGPPAGTPTQENCQFIMRAPAENAWIIGYRSGQADVAYLNKSGVWTIPGLKSSSGTRYLVVDTSGNITSSASAPSGT